MVAIVFIVWSNFKQSSLTFFLLKQEEKKEYSIFFVLRFRIEVLTLLFPGKTHLHSQECRLSDSRNGSLPDSERYTTKLCLYLSQDHLTLDQPDDLRLRNHQPSHGHCLDSSLLFNPYLRMFHRRGGSHSFPNLEIQPQPTVSGLDGPTR